MQVGERVHGGEDPSVLADGPATEAGEIALGLAEQFELNHVALRLWNLPELPDSGYGEPVTQDVRTFADSLKAPYCGTDTAFELSLIHI